MDKRILSIILTIILCMSCLTPAFAATDLDAVDVFNKKIWDTDFDSFAVDTETENCKDPNGIVYLPKWWNTVSQIAEAPVDAETHGNVMRLVSGSDSSLAQINSNEALVSGVEKTVWKLQQDFLFEDTSSSLEYRLLNEGMPNIHNTLFAVDTAGLLTLPSAATNTENYNTYKNLSKNVWYTFTIIVDTDADEYSLYINGDEITKSASLTSKIDGFKKIHMRFGKASAAAGFGGVCLDNFSCYVQTPFILETTSIEDQATNCSLTEPVIFTYTGSLKELPTIKMTKAGAEFTDFTAAYTKNVLTVTFNNPLDRLTTYEIKVENASNAYNMIIPLSQIHFTTTDGLSDLERVDQYNNVVWNTDFEEFSVGTSTSDCKDANEIVYLPKFWNVDTQIANAPGTHGKAMKLISGTDSTIAQINSNASFTSGRSDAVWKIQQDLLLEPTSSSIEYTILNPGEKSNVINKLFSVDVTGILSLPKAATNASNFSKYKTLTKGEWYTFTIIVNTDTDQYSLYINDDEITKDAALATAVDSFVQIHIRCGKASAEAGFCGVYIDNFSGSTKGIFKIKGTSVVNNETDCDLSLPVTFTYSRVLKGIPAVTMTKDGQPFSGFAATSSGDRLQISFNNPLERDTTYTIKVKNAEDMFGSIIAETQIAFRTTDVFRATAPIFTNGTFVITELPSSGTVKVMSDFKNGSADTVNATLVAALYDENDMLIALLPSAEKTLASGEHEMGVTVSVPVDSYHDLSCIKAMVVDTLTNFRAHDTSYAVLGREEAVTESKGKAEVILTQFSQKEENGKDFYKITGRVTPVLKKMVLITITDESNHVWNIMPVTTTPEGAFEVLLPVNVAADTALKIRVNGAGITNAVEKDAWFIGTSRTEILNAINSSTEAAEVQTALTNYVTKMAGTDSRLTAESFCQNGYQTLVENRPYAKIDDAMEIIAKAEILLNRLNHNHSSYYEEIITENHAIILKGYEKDYNTYAKMSEQEKGKVAADVIALGSVSSLAEFRKNFSKVISGNGTSGSGGNKIPAASGGGSGGFYGPVSEAVKNDEYKNDNSESAASEEIFADLRNYEWARESIEALWADGIVKGDGNGNFRPEDGVTREEFTKMLVLVYGIELENAEIVFADVADDAWYAPYVRTAYAVGITTGESKTSFGIGKKILRQDMAVMCARTLEQLGYGIESKADLDFKDTDSIDEYAKAAVARMKGIGIINGTDGGVFLPLDSANRAEAAKIIYGLRQYCEEKK